MSAPGIIRSAQTQKGRQQSGTAKHQSGHTETALSGRLSAEAVEKRLIRRQKVPD